MNNTNQSFLDKMLSEKDEHQSNFEVDLLPVAGGEKDFILKIKDKNTGEVEEVKMTGLDTSGAVNTPMDIKHIKDIAKIVRPAVQDDQKVFKIEAAHFDAKNFLVDQDNKNKGGTSFADAIGSLRKQYIEGETGKDEKLKIK